MVCSRHGANSVFYGTILPQYLASIISTAKFIEQTLCTQLFRLCIRGPLQHFRPSRSGEENCLSLCYHPTLCLVSPMLLWLVRQRLYHTVTVKRPEVPPLQTALQAAKAKSGNHLASSRSADRSRAQTSCSVHATCRECRRISLTDKWTETTPAWLLTALCSVNISINALKYFTHAVSLCILFCQPSEMLICYFGGLSRVSGRCVYVQFLQDFTSQSLRSPFRQDLLASKNKPTHTQYFWQ